MGLCQQSDVSAFYYTVQFCRSFRSKEQVFLVLQLQSLPTMILKPKKTKSVTTFTFPAPICQELMGQQPFLSPHLFSGLITISTCPLELNPKSLLITGFWIRQNPFPHLCKQFFLINFSQVILISVTHLILAKSGFLLICLQ